ncbi:MAG TPA: TIGR02147 family protein [Bdellovibrionales bacterium]|nr:TIGR02147 family protein [Bdellovibrionales bacterium]
MFPSEVRIYDFDRVANYLEARFLDKKARRPRYSLRQFAVRIGFPDSGSLSRVLKEKRAITLASAQKIAKKLELSTNERLYFFQLVLLQDASAEVRVPLLQSLRQNLARQEFVESNVEENLQIIADHRSLAVRECLRLRDPLRRPPMLNRIWRESTAVPDFCEIFQRLEKLKLVNWDGGHWTPHSGDPILFSPKKTSRAIRHYHASWLGAAANALQNLAPEERNFQGTTLAIPAGAQEEIVRKLTALHHEIMALGRERDADQVLHIGTYLIPVTSTPDLETEDA